MAFKRLSMRKIHRALRLFFEAGLSIRAIARSIQASPSTVGEYTVGCGARERRLKGGTIRRRRSQPI